MKNLREDKVKKVGAQIIPNQEPRVTTISSTDQR